MHRYYTRVDPDEQLKAMERTFGRLRLLKSETGDGAEVDAGGSSGGVTNAAS